MAHKQIFVELEKVEKENTLNSGRPRGDSHKLQNIPWSCIPLVITLQFQLQVEKNYVENVTKITSELIFNGTEIAGSGVLNYPNYSFEQCSLQIQGESGNKKLNGKICKDSNYTAMTAKPSKKVKHILDKPQVLTEFLTAAW